MTHHILHSHTVIVCSHQPGRKAATCSADPPHILAWSNLLLFFGARAPGVTNTQHVHSTIRPAHLCKSTRMLGRRLSFWAPNFASALTAAGRENREASEVQALHTNRFSQQTRSTVHMVVPKFQLERLSRPCHKFVKDMERLNYFCIFKKK